MATLRFLIFGLVVVGFFSGEAIQGAEWKFLETNSQGQFFYDAENITRSSANTVAVWLRVVYSKEFKGREGLHNLNQTVGLWEINCEEKEVCLLSTTHYSEESEILPPQAWLPPEWKSIGPDTVIDVLYKELCRKGNCILQDRKE